MSLSDLCRHRNVRTFSVCAENFTGEKGKGGMSVNGYAASCAEGLGQGWKVSPCIGIPAGEVFTLADVRGEGAIRHIWITESAPSGRSLILRIYWDGNETPSVEVPLGDFFVNPAYDGHHQISSLAVCVNPNKAMNCYFEMPYRRGFRITLENTEPNEVCVYYQIDCEEKPVGGDALYFHAQFRRVNPVPYKEVYTVLDNIRGRGQYVGTMLYWGVHNNGWWGEGEFKFYIDGDTDFPTVCGTGTEDYFCGAYNFDPGDGYRDFSTPYSGFYGNRVDTRYQSQRRFAMYRWHINEPVYFENDLRVTVQALGWRQGTRRYLPLQDDISSVAYWYSDRLDDVYPDLPSPDELQIN